MRLGALARPAALILPIITALLLPAPAQASVHLMQIEKIAGGVQGDATAQAIQLRMRAVGQNQTQRGLLRVVDATGSNPITLASPAVSVANSGAGTTVLFATAAFSSHTNPPAVPDFTMAAIPASYLAAGSLTFEDATFGTISWRVSWGGVAYSGSTIGAGTNDADAEFAPNFAAALPSAGLTALIFVNSATALSTNNAADYAESGAGVSFRNNAGTDFTVEGTPTASPVAVRAAAVLNPVSPNPFNPRTEISFEVAREGHALLKVFALDGTLVDVLHDGFVAAGTRTVEWNGTDRAGRLVASGVYVVRLSAAGVVASRSVTLIK
jgi:hypothetical protein